jgi:hypothetical protein
MPEEEQRDTDQTDPPEPVKFDNYVPSAAGGLRLAGRPDLAEWVERNVYRPSDLTTEEGQQKMKEIRELENNFGPLIAKDFQQYADAERAEQERVAKEQADAEHENLMAKARQKLESERRKSAEAAELNRAMQAVKDEEAAAAAAAGNPLPDPMADAELMISRAVDVIDSPHVDLETKATMAHEAIEAYGAAQSGSKQRPVDIDPDAFIEQFNKTEE